MRVAKHKTKMIKRNTRSCWLKGTRNHNDEKGKNLWLGGVIVGMFQAWKRTIKDNYNYESCRTQDQDDQEKHKTVSINRNTKPQWLRRQELMARRCHSWNVPRLKAHLIQDHEYN